MSEHNSPSGDSNDEVQKQLKEDDPKPQSVKRGRGRPRKSDTQKKSPQSGRRSRTTSKSTKLKREALPLNENIDPALFQDLPPSKRPRLIGENKTRREQPPKAPKPLFSAQALRSNFNPLPKTLVNYSSPEEVAINPRCGNTLNSFTFQKFQWLEGVQIETQFLLIFGAGDMGQMGLGPEKLDDVRKPAIHTLIEELRAKNDFAAPLHFAAGGMHSLVIDSNGKIWSWGINDNAALGRQTEGIEGVEQEELETRPMNVSTLSPQVEPNTGGTPFKAARVSAGDSVSVAISEEGELVAWGSFRSNDGLLGFDGKVGTSPKQLVPTRVSNLSAFPVAQVICGYDHVLALTTTGHVYSWGNGQQQQLGRKIIERRKKNGLAPERLSLKKIVLVGSGGSHSFAVNEDGLVYGWGLNTRGQLGISSEESVWEQEIVSIPTLVRAMSPDKHNGARVVAVEGGDFHTLFLLNNGQVWAVGSYENSEIGIKSTASEIIAIEKERTEGLVKKEAFIEKELKNRKLKFEQALTKYNERTKDKPDQAEAGEDDTPPRWDEMNERLEVEQEAASQGFVPGRCLRTPIRIEFPHPIIDISCGTRHNLAVDNQGNAYSWGLGQSNELGQGTDEDGEEIELVESPRLLTSKALTQGIHQGKLKVIQCAAGGNHSLLLAINTLEPNTIESNTLKPNTLKPNTLEPNTVESNTLEPSTLEPNTLESNTLELNTLEPNILEPNNLEPKTNGTS